MNKNNDIFFDSKDKCFISWLHSLEFWVFFFYCIFSLLFYEQNIMYQVQIQLSDNLRKSNNTNCSSMHAPDPIYLLWPKWIHQFRSGCWLMSWPHTLSIRWFVPFGRETCTMCMSKDHKLCFENSIKIKHLMCLSMTPNLIFIQTKQTWNGKKAINLIKVITHTVNVPHNHIYKRKNLRKANQNNWKDSLISSLTHAFSLRQKVSSSLAFSTKWNLCVVMVVLLFDQSWDRY